MASLTYCSLLWFCYQFIIYLIDKQAEMLTPFGFINFYCTNHLIGRTLLWELSNMMIYPIHTSFVLSLHVQYLVGYYMSLCIPLRIWVIGKSWLPF